MTFYLFILMKAKLDDYYYCINLATILKKGDYHKNLIAPVYIAFLIVCIL